MLCRLMHLLQVKLKGEMTWKIWGEGLGSDTSGGKKVTGGEQNLHLHENCFIFGIGRFEARCIIQLWRDVALIRSL